jgi:3-oxoacyl-[acyl-carrier-protein] synthase-3
MQQAEPQLFVHGMGHFHPENVLDNAFLESLDIGTTDSWILERVGIRSRRTVLPLDYVSQTKNADPRESHNASVYSNAQTGAHAARMALSRAKLSISDIGLVVAGGCSPQFSIPSEACRIASELGIEVPCFDLNSACSSFGAQLHFLRSMNKDMSADYILVVNAENNTRTVNYADRSSAVLWGDATSAAIVSLKHESALKVTTSCIESDPAGWDKVVIPAGGHFSQSGRAVQTFAIRKTLATLCKLREHSNCTPERQYFISHQANLLMLENVAARAEVLAANHLFNVDQFGNCGAAGAPSVLSQNWDKFVPGDEIALVVVGSGLTWSGLLFSFGG